RWKNAAPPELYFSPIDNRLHLVGAQGGLWNLGGGLELRLDNLAGGDHLDSWELVSRSGEAGTLEERLVTFGDYQLFHDGSSVTIRQAAVPPRLFTVAPPTDAAQWASFRNLIAPYAGTERDPLALRDWQTD